MNDDHYTIAILAHIANNSGTTVQIARAIGKGVSAVRMRLVAMERAGRISRLHSKGITFVYGALVVAQPAAAKPKRSEYEVREYGVHRLDGSVSLSGRINRVSLPIYRPLRDVDAILQGLAAQTAGRASTGQVCGVSGYHNQTA